MRKVCVFIGSRANYSSIKSAMRAIHDHPDLALQVVAGASALLDRYGSVIDLIERDGFTVDGRVYMLLEGDTPAIMAKSTGIGLMELPTIFEILKPDIVLTVGDRFETMATTLAAAYMNIPIAHSMGGEVTGTIDESIRHAVTKFSHIHFPASKDAALRIQRLGERVEDIYLVGCPRMDLVADILSGSEEIDENIFDDGVGDVIDLSKPFILVSQHPVTTEFSAGESQISETLSAVERTGLPSIVLWPNSDAGSEGVSRGIRKWKERVSNTEVHYFKNLPVDIYIKLMKKAACLVGNSSSGIREGAFIGTPVVNIGSRQDMRERGSNVIGADYDAGLIYKAILKQLENGPYCSDPIYGDGKAGVRIAEVLSTCSWNIQKRISY